MLLELSPDAQHHRASVRFRKHLRITVLVSALVWIATDRAGASSSTSSQSSNSNTSSANSPSIMAASLPQGAAQSGTSATPPAPPSNLEVVTIIPSPSGSFDGPAELPRVYVQSAMADTPAPGVVIPVSPGTNLQTVINQAACGDTISLQAGATFSVMGLKLPAKNCDDQHWIIIRTSAPDSSLPPEGTRINPSYAGITSLPGRPTFSGGSGDVMAKILVAPYNSISIAGDHYRLLGLEVTRPVGGGTVYELVSINATGASYVVLDRMWIHGTAQDETTRGIALAGTYVALVDSYLTDFHCIAVSGTCTDSQAIGGGGGSNPMGPYRILDNFLEAAGENIMFGGAAATMTPADIEIRLNHLFKPLIWMKGQPGFVGGANGNPFIVKNNFELKNAQRVLYEGNIADYTWGGFSQSGFTILLTPKNPGRNLCPLCKVTDVTIRYSVSNHMAAGMQIANALSDAGGAALDGGRYSIHDMVFDDMNASLYQGDPLGVQISNDWSQNVLHDVAINHVTMINDPAGGILAVGNRTNFPEMTNISITNSIVNGATYPVWSTGGGPINCAYHDVPITTITACFSPYQFSGNLIMGENLARWPLADWPTGNYFPAGASSVGFANYTGGDYLLCQGPGVPASSCVSASSYANAGTDGKSPGANIVAVDSTTLGVQ